MCFVDGNNVYPMPLAQDHKRAFDDDKGPNTGGMGAYTALPFISEEDRTFAFENILCPVAGAMVKEGCPLSGVLYGGLMKTLQGIKVIEFNARFGDPETEVVLPLLETDAFEIFSSIAEGKPLKPLEWNKKVTLGVVMASTGYPGSYEKGYLISGLENVNSRVYHMGTKFGPGGDVLTSGGRVLMVVVEAPTVFQARELAYMEIGKIHCDNLFYRKDIAHCALHI